jgi:hypothetical protein
MRTVFWNFVLATWLFVSAFAFTRVPASMWVATVAAVAIFVLAAASTGRPSVRYLNAAIALVLAACALLLTDVSGIARVSDALVAALLFALSLVSPVHAKREERAVGAAG